jgi:large subunit ribosomal protein L17
MRHNVAGYKLGRSVGQRNSLRRTMLNQFFTNERMQTTRAKALSIRSEAEQMITIARNSAKGDEIAKVNARRLIASRQGDPAVVKKLFDEIAPRYANRNGGYTRLFKLGLRQGDGAEMVLLELFED